MLRGWQLVANLALYGFLFWLLYDSMIAEWDPWFGFVVAFVIVVAAVVSLVPKIHAPTISPGSYPFDE